VEELKPESMTDHFERNVPLGHTRCLTYFSFLLANLWKRAEEGDMEKLQADLLLAFTFAEQVATEGGSEYMLGWLLTGLEDPPWSTVEQHKPSGRGLANAHARLADPRVVTANLAYVRDMDAMYERTQNTHLRGKGKGTAPETDPNGPPRPQPKRQPEGGGKGQPGPAAE